MSSVLSSKGLVLATSMAVSAGTVILFDLLREKYFRPTQFQDSPPAKQLLKSCLSSGSQKIEKKNKKKRVKFADDVKDSRGNSELYRKLHRKSSKDEATCRGNEILGYNGRMPANRVALYSGILKDRVQRIGLDFPYQCMHSSGCLGCQTYHKLTSSLEKPLKGKNLHASKAGTSEDFLTTSTFEMEDNKVESRGSISPISKSTQMHDAPGAGCSNNPSDFINHGLLLWYQIRQNWIKNKKPLKHSQQLREPRIHWNASYDSLLGGNKRFSKPVPLGEMVDFLVDIWEQEGMYD